MKRFFIIAVVAALVVGLMVGCGGKEVTYTAPDGKSYTVSQYRAYAEELLMEYDDAKQMFYEAEKSGTPNGDRQKANENLARVIGEFEKMGFSVTYSPTGEADEVDVAEVEKVVLMDDKELEEWMETHKGKEDIEKRLDE